MARLAGHVISCVAISIIWSSITSYLRYVNNVYRTFGTCGSHKIVNEQPGCGQESLQSSIISKSAPVDYGYVLWLSIMNSNAVII